MKKLFPLFAIAIICGMLSCQSENTTHIIKYHDVSSGHVSIKFIDAAGITKGDVMVLNSNNVMVDSVMDNNKNNDKIDTITFRNLKDNSTFIKLEPSHGLLPGDIMERGCGKMAKVINIAHYK